MKPVDLIVSTIIHANAGRLESLPEGVREAALAKCSLQDVAVEIGRKLLCEIAYEAPLPAVMKALEAAGAPATIEEIAQRFAAAREQHRGMITASDLAKSGVLP